MSRPQPGMAPLPCLAFNTAQAYRLAAGQRLAKRGIRRLRREHRRALATAPVVYVARSYAVLAVEEQLAALGRPVQESLLPFGGQKEATQSREQQSVTEKPP